MICLHTMLKGFAELNVVGAFKRLYDCVMASTLATNTTIAGQRNTNYTRTVTTTSLGKRSRCRYRIRVHEMRCTSILNTTHHSNPCAQPRPAKHCISLQRHPTCNVPLHNCNCNIVDVGSIVLEEHNRMVAIRPIHRKCNKHYMFIF